MEQFSQILLRPLKKKVGGRWKEIRSVSPRCGSRWWQTPGPGWGEVLGIRQDPALTPSRSPSSPHGEDLGSPL